MAYPYSCGTFLNWMEGKDLLKTLQTFDFRLKFMIT